MATTPVGVVSPYLVEEGYHNITDGRRNTLLHNGGVRSELSKLMEHLK